jgi:hypothetical protein
MELSNDDERKTRLARMRRSSAIDDRCLHAPNLLHEQPSHDH